MSTRSGFALMRVPARMVRQPISATLPPSAAAWSSNRCRDFVQLIESRDGVAESQRRVVLRRRRDLAR